MSASLGWVMAGVALIAGWLTWGWQGLVLAISVVAFWLLLQFSRSLRVLRQAAGSPVGHVAGAVMLNAKLKRGMRLPEVIGLTRSLGIKLADAPETYAWRDAGQVEVRVVFENGRCARWELARPLE